MMNRIFGKNKNKKIKMNRKKVRRVIACIMGTVMMFGTNYGYVPAYVAETEEVVPTVGARSETNESTGDVFLGGNYIEVGISKHGSFGTSVSPQNSSFHPYISGLGLVSDGDGWDVGEEPVTGDFFLPGTPEERWILSYKIDGTAYECMVADRNGVYTASRYKVEPTVTDESDKENRLLKAVVSGTTAENVEFQIIYSFGVDDKFYNTEVIIQNKGNKEISDVRFVRSFDPDQDQQTQGTYSTNNKVICNPNKEEKASETNYAMVVARGEKTMAGFFFMAFDNRAVATRGVAFNPSSAYWPGLDVNTVTETCATDELIACSSDDLNGYTNEDNAIALLFDLGTVSIGSDVTCNFYSSLDPNVIESVKNVLNAFSASIKVSSNRIEVSDLDENYVYALADEDGNRLTDWMTPDEEQKIVFENLESDTKYKLVAVSKDETNKDSVEKQPVSDISTALDPLKKTEEGKEVVCIPAMTSISFENLNEEYTYCLQDENKKIVKSWTTTSGGAITFEDLLPETDYYLVAKSDSNATSDRVLYRTLDATDEYKIETAKKVTTETLAKYTAKNETTKEILKNEIKDALSKNRFTTEVEAEITKWNVKEADVDNLGSIEGKVVLSLNSLSREVTIDKEIAKLPMIESINISPSTYSIVKGNYVWLSNFSVKITGKNNPDEAVEWSLTGNKSENTQLCYYSYYDTYYLSVGANETAASLTLTATSKFDPSKSASVTIIVEKTAAERVGDAKRAVENILADMTVTNDTTKETIETLIQNALDGKGFEDVTITVEDVTVEQATIENAGKVTGNIKISKDSASENVTVDKEIAKLPKDDQEKIQQVVTSSAIKEIMSEVVTDKGTDITQDDVKNAVSAQLSEKGVEGAEITISNFTKQEGTATSQGYVKGTVNVTKDGITESVSFKQVLPASEQEQSYKVSGKILDENEAAMGGVIVKLMQGNVEIDASISKSNTGEYEFGSLPVGVYNIVAYTGDRKKTQKVEITSTDETVDVKLPGEGVRSNLEVKDNVVENSSFIAQAVVGGLDEEAEEVAKTLKATHIGSSIDVDIKMNIEAKASKDVATEKKVEKDAIDSVSKVSDIRKAEYFDIKVNKTTIVDGQTESELMSQTNSVMEIIIPFDMKGKYNIVPYRYHEGSVNVFSKSDTKQDGTYKIDESNQLIYIYTQKFSTYAIGYDTQKTTVTPTPGSSSSGGSSSYYPVTGITLSKENATLTKKGETLQLTASISPSYATNKNIIWSSDNEAVATVDSTGKVTAVGNGTAKITATTQSGSRTATVVITVNITPEESAKPSVPADTDKPSVTNTPEPTVTEVPATPEVTNTPVVTATPVVTEAPKETEAPKPTETPKVSPVPTEQPTVTSKPKKVTSDFGALKAKSVKQTNTTITLSWTKVSDADGYLVYGSRCNHDGKKYTKKLIKTIKGNKTVSWTQKALKKATYYKYQIKAYKIVDGKKVIIAKSVDVHAVTKGGKHCVASSVKVTKIAGKKVSGKSLKLTLSKGKTAKIQAVETPAEKNKTIHKHRALSYETSNSKVATVTENGKIKAVGKGTCSIWVYAQNGVYKTITITVK